MAFSNQIKATLGLDVKPFEQGLADAQKFATQGAAKIEATFNRSFFRGILTGVGIGSVSEIRELITAPWKDAADYAKQVEESTKNQLAYVKAKVQADQSPGQNLDYLKQQEKIARQDVADRQREVDAIKNDPGLVTTFSSGGFTNPELQASIAKRRREANEAAEKYGGGLFTRNSSTLATAQEALNQAQNAQADIQAKIKTGTAGQTYADKDKQAVADYDKNTEDLRSAQEERSNIVKGRLASAKQEEEEWNAGAVKRETDEAIRNLSGLDPASAAGLKKESAAIEDARKKKQQNAAQARAGEIAAHQAEVAAQSSIDNAEYNRRKVDLTSKIDGKLVAGGKEQLDALAAQQRARSVASDAASIEIQDQITKEAKLGSIEEERFKKEIDLKTQLADLDRERVRLNENALDTDRRRYGFILQDVLDGKRGNADDATRARQIDRLEKRARQLYDFGNQGGYVNDAGRSVTAQQLAGDVQHKADLLRNQFDRLSLAERYPMRATEEELKLSNQHLAQIQTALTGVDATSATSQGTSGGSGAGPQSGPTSPSVTGGGSGPGAAQGSQAQNGFPDASSGFPEATSDLSGTHTGAGTHQTPYAPGHPDGF